jgi:hypothetical protein
LDGFPKPDQPRVRHGWRGELKKVGKTPGCSNLHIVEFYFLIVDGGANFCMSMVTAGSQSLGGPHPGICRGVSKNLAPRSKPHIIINTPIMTIIATCQLADDRRVSASVLANFSSDLGFCMSLLRASVNIACRVKVCNRSIFAVRPSAQAGHFSGELCASFEVRSAAPTSRHGCPEQGRARRNAEEAYSI